MYNLNEDYSLGQLITLVIVFLVAYGIAKLVALFGLVTKGNMNKWAVTFAAFTGIMYAVYMSDFIVTKNEFLMFIGLPLFAIFGGFISWLFFWLAFASVCKDEKEK